METPPMAMKLSVSTQISFINTSEALLQHEKLRKMHEFFFQKKRFFLKF